jgi:hypothetical protein
MRDRQPRSDEMLRNGVACCSNAIGPVHVKSQETRLFELRRTHCCPLDRQCRQGGSWSASKLALALVVISCLSGLTVSATVKETRRVLVLYEAGFSFPDIAIVDQEIRTTLAKSPYQIELYTENMEEVLFPEKAFQQEIREWYIHKYRNRKPDVIIAEGPPPLKFMVEAHERFFPGTPIVFC